MLYWNTLFYCINNENTFNKNAYKFLHLTNNIYNYWDHNSFGDELPCCCISFCFNRTIIISWQFNKKKQYQNTPERWKPKFSLKTNKINKENKTNHIYTYLTWVYGILLKNSIVYKCLTGAYKILGNWVSQWRCWVRVSREDTNEYSCRGVEVIE